jgi:hypothetical protein
VALAPDAATGCWRLSIVPLFSNRLIEAIWNSF